MCVFIFMVTLTCLYLSSFIDKVSGRDESRPYEFSIFRFQFSIIDKAFLC